MQKNVCTFPPYFKISFSGLTSKIYERSEANFSMFKANSKRSDYILTRNSIEEYSTIYNLKLARTFYQRMTASSTIMQDIYLLKKVQQSQNQGNSKIFYQFFDEERFPLVSFKKSL